MQLVEFLDHEEDATAHFLSQQGQLDVVLVFISVADDERVGVDVDGEHGMQLGFGTGFEADVRFLAVAYDFFHDGAHLVHLYGVDDEVLSRVAIFVGSLFEAMGDFLDAVVENIGKTYQGGSRDVSYLKLVHQLFQVDGGGTFFGCYRHMPFFVDGKIL